MKYFHRKRNIKELDIHALFHAGLFVALGNLRDLGYHVVLDMKSNNDFHYSYVSAAITDIRIKEVVINNNRGGSVPSKCAKNKEHNQFKIFGCLKTLRSSVAVSYPSTVYIWT